MICNNLFFLLHKRNTAHNLKMIAFHSLFSCDLVLYFDNRSSKDWYTIFQYLTTDTHIIPGVIRINQFHIWSSNE